MKHQNIRATREEERGKRRGEREGGVRWGVGERRMEADISGVVELGQEKSQRIRMNVN